MIFCLNGGINMITTLDNVPINTIATVNKISCDWNIRRRLMDLGIIEDTKIIPVLTSPTGDSKAYDVRKTILALRQDDAKDIFVNI